MHHSVVLSMLCCSCFAPITLKPCYLSYWKDHIVAWSYVWNLLLSGAYCGRWRRLGDVWRYAPFRWRQLGRKGFTQTWRDELLCVGHILSLSDPRHSVVRQVRCTVLQFNTNNILSDRPYIGHILICCLNLPSLKSDCVTWCIQFWCLVQWPTFNIVNYDECDSNPVEICFWYRQFFCFQLCFVIVFWILITTQHDACAAHIIYRHILVVRQRHLSCGVCLYIRVYVTHCIRFLYVGIALQPTAMWYLLKRFNIISVW